MTTETVKEMFYSLIELTDEEKEAAILEGKKKKYFHLKNKGYWESMEGQKQMVRLKEVAKEFDLL